MALNILEAMDTSFLVRDGAFELLFVLGTAKVWVAAQMIGQPRRHPLKSALAPYTGLTNWGVKKGVPTALPEAMAEPSRQEAPHVPLPR